MAHRADLIEEQVFSRLSEFNQRAGMPPIVIDFEDLHSGTDLSQCTLCGVKFTANNARLIVVRGDETYTPAGFTDFCGAKACQLQPTTGDQLLSPGGPALMPGPRPAYEDDDLVLTFDPPVSAIGFDHLSQHADGLSYTHVEVISVDGTVLYEGIIPIASSMDNHEVLGGKRIMGFDALGDEDGLPNTDFWGFVSSAANIREVRIDERDDNNVCPDSNIGIDSLRFLPASCGAVGDIDGDGTVTQLDAQELIEQWGEHAPATPMGPQWSPADLNRDGRVDASDLILLMSHLK